MTKGTFKDVIAKIRENEKKDHELTDFLEEYIDGFLVMKSTPLWEAIKIIFIDEFGKDGLDVIEWWMFEDCDKCVYNEDGSLYKDVTDVGDLYDYISGFSQKEAE